MDTVSDNPAHRNGSSPPASYRAWWGAVLAEFRGVPRHAVTRDAVQRVAERMAPDYGTNGRVPSRRRVNAVAWSAYRRIHTDTDRPAVTDAYRQLQRERGHKSGRSRRPHVDGLYTDIAAVIASGMTRAQAALKVNNGRRDVSMETVRRAVRWNRRMAASVGHPELVRTEGMPGVGEQPLPVAPSWGHEPEHPHGVTNPPMENPEPDTDHPTDDGVTNRDTPQGGHERSSTRGDGEDGGRLHLPSPADYVGDGVDSSSGALPSVRKNVRDPIVPPMSPLMAQVVIAMHVEGGDTIERIADTVGHPPDDVRRIIDEHLDGAA